MSVGSDFPEPGTERKDPSHAMSPLENGFGREDLTVTPSLGQHLVRCPHPDSALL